MTEKLVCATSKASITNDAGRVVFPCPECGTEIIRSLECRKSGTRYKCSKCGFTGPN